MIWIGIGIILFIFSIIVIKIQVHKTISDWLEIFSVISFLFSIIILSVSLTLILIRFSREELDIQEAQDKYNFYTNLLEEDEDVIIQNQLYNDIIEYNDLVRSNKHYSESLWTNWFLSEKWREMKEIELSK